MQHVDPYVAAPKVDVQKCPPEGCGSGRGGGGGSAAGELPVMEVADEDSDKREL